MRHDALETCPKSAVPSACELLESRVLFATVPLAPTELNASSSSNRSVDLIWTDRSTDETGFDIFRKGPGAATYVKLTTVAANTSRYTDSAVTANSAYFYQVRALNSAGPSAFSYLGRVFTAAVPDYVIDNTNTPRVTVTGTWTVDASTPAYGVNGLLDGNAGKGQKSVAYNTILASGRYEVYARWTSATNRSTRTPITLVNGPLVRNFTVDQTRNGQAWQKLGTYDLSGNASTVLTISNANTDGVVSADAVMFVNLTKPDVQWTTVARAPVAKDEAQVANLDGKMFVFGGFNPSGPTRSSHVYNPLTDQWAALPDMPTALSHSGTTVAGRDVYFAGGYVGTGSGFNQIFGVREVWKFNVDTRTYSAFTPLPQPRGSGALVHLQGKLHFFGGVSPNDRADRGDHWIFNLSRPDLGWVTSVSLPNPRSHMAYVSFQNKVYAIGGQRGTDARLVTQPDVHVWNPLTPDRWTLAAPLTPARSHTSSSTFVMGNRIIVLGGETSFGAHSSTVTSYDPISNTWSIFDPLPTRKSSGVGVLLGAELYFSGGVGSTATYKGVFLA